MAVERTVVRGRREGPGARLPKAGPGEEAQPTNFGHVLWGAILFISSELMFFAALFTVYFYLRGRIPEWEPIFGEKPGWTGLPLINTIELVTSSVTMQIAMGAIKKDNLPLVRRLLVVTVILGAAFVIGQGYEYTRLGFLPQDGIFAGVFFLLTGFHGAHVTGGLILLIYCMIRAFKGQWSSRRHLALEGVSLYWHFVDVVWIGLFTTIYIIG